MIRLWVRVGAAWYAWTCTTADAADIMARLGERVGRWAIDGAPTWPVVEPEPPARVSRFGGNDSGIRAAVAGWPEVCATCRDPIVGRSWSTGHGPECSGCIERYAD